MNILKTQVIQSAKLAKKSMKKEIPRKAKDLTRQIARSISIDLFPITSAEMKYIENILMVVEPLYRMPSEKYLFDTAITQLYDEIKNKMSLIIHNDLIKGVSSISLTIDGWICRSITDFMSVTVHYWTYDFQPRKFFLQLECLPKMWNTAEDLFHLLQIILLKSGFSKQNPKIHLVTANSHNIIQAVSLSQDWKRIPCFAQIIQLVVEDVLNKFEDFDTLVEKCKFLISTLWSRSAVQLNSKKKGFSIENENFETSSMLDDFVPSWTSVYEMFENFLKLKTTIAIFIQQFEKFPQVLTESDWEQMESYVKVFSLLKQASCLMSQQDYPPLSLYIPTIRAMLELVHSNDRHNPLNSCLIHSIFSRFRDISMNESLIIAMVLDPRFKTRLLTDEEKIVVLHIIRNKLIISFQHQDKTLNPSPKTTLLHQIGNYMRTVINKPINNLKKCKTIYKYLNSLQIFHSLDSQRLEMYFDDIKNKRDTDYEPTKLVEAELSHYLCEKIEPMHTQIHKWWKINILQFPNLSLLAKVYLSIPSVQIETNRAFSNKEGFKIDKRTELSSRQLKELEIMKISFLHGNLRQFSENASI